MNPVTTGDAPVPQDGLSRATAQLRAVRSPRAVEIADAVLERVLNTPRPAELVRARSPHNRLQVSTVVVVAVLRDRLDSALPGAAVGRIRPLVDGDGRLRELTVELFVRYGVDILALGRLARVLTLVALVELLGEEAGPADAVPVTVTHVHVSDVTVGDPGLVDPADE